MLKYKRILFKVSGESLMGEKLFGHDMTAIQKTCEETTKSASAKPFRRKITLPMFRYLNSAV